MVGVYLQGRDGSLTFDSVSATCLVVADWFRTPRCVGAGKCLGRDLISWGRFQSTCVQHDTHRTALPRPICGEPMSIECQHVAHVQCFGQQDQRSVGEGHGRVRYLFMSATASCSSGGALRPNTCISLAATRSATVRGPPALALTKCIASVITALVVASLPKNAPPACRERGVCRIVRIHVGDQGASVDDPGRHGRRFRSASAMRHASVRVRHKRERPFR